MSLRTSVTVKDEPTDITVTAGTDRSYINDGRGTTGVNKLVDVAEGNLQLRRSFTTKLKQPVPAPNPKAFATLGRSELVVYHPFVDSNGKVYQLPAPLSIPYHPEMSEADRVKILLNTLAIAADSDLRDFFTKGVNA